MSNNKAVEYIKNLPEFAEYDNVYQFLRWQDTVWEGDYDHHRHWATFERVVRVNDKLIGYVDAFSGGDMSAEEKGFEFDEDSVSFYKAVQKIVISYEVIHD